MNKKTLIKYAEMKGDLKAFTEKVKEQEGKVIKTLRVAGLDSVKIEALGSFAIVQYKTWEYSPNLQAAEAHLNELKKIEREVGIAKVAGDNEGVRFTASKHHDAF